MLRASGAPRVFNEGVCSLRHPGNPCPSIAEHWISTWKYLEPDMHQRCINFFLFRPRSYYKLSLCVTFGNTFNNLCKSWRAYVQWRVVLTSFMKLVASMLGRSSILSANFWPSLLISSLTCDTFESGCRVSLVTYQGASTMILRYLFWNLCTISVFELEALPHNRTT